MLFDSSWLVATMSIGSFTVGIFGPYFIHFLNYFPFHFVSKIETENE